jgi:aminopeptidase-like protein
MGGINLTCVGDERCYSFLSSKYENTIFDKIALKTLKKNNINFKYYSFLERGSDERQYSSPGIDIPFISVMRSKYGKYKEYHTSLDDFKLVTQKGLLGSAKIIKEILNSLLKLKEDIFYKKKITNTNSYKNPKSLVICEPFLTKRKMYPTLSRVRDNQNIKNYLNFLQYADGFNSLAEISKKIKLEIFKTKKIFKHLKSLKLVK